MADRRGFSAALTMFYAYHCPYVCSALCPMHSLGGGGQPYYQLHQDA